MISANIKNDVRREVYRRDGWRCALCDSTKYIQVHHVIARGRGGKDHPHNLVTLCSDCHGQVHGLSMYEGVSKDDIAQAITEYLADLYAPDWNPWRKNREPWRRE